MTRDSDNSPPFERGMFLCNTWNFERFQYFNSQTSFLKNTNPFKKTAVMFLVESARTEISIWPYETVKTYRMGSTKWIYHKEQNISKFYFSLRTSYKELVRCTNYPKVHIHTSWKCKSFIWGCCFGISQFIFDDSLENVLVYRLIFYYLVREILRCSSNTTKL